MDKLPAGRCRFEVEYLGPTSKPHILKAAYIRTDYLHEKKLDIEKRRTDIDETLSFDF